MQDCSQDSETSGMKTDPKFYISFQRAGLLASMVFTLMRSVSGIAMMLSLSWMFRVVVRPGPSLNSATATF